MSNDAADWELVFGLFSVRLGLVDRSTMIAARHESARDNQRSIDEVLLDNGAIDDSERQLLHEIIQLHQVRCTDAFSVVRSLFGSQWDVAKRDLSNLDDETLNAFMGKTDFQVSGALETASINDSNQASLPRDAHGGMRFRMLRDLEGGEGGMGVIAVAKDEELGREVALKQIRPEFADNDRFRQKFRLEAEITGKLEHPGTVPVYGLGELSDGRPYYAMRLVVGEDLTTAIRSFHEQRSEGNLSYDSVEFRSLIDHLIDVAQTVSYAHSRGVLHRDLKPRNILLGGFGETLVIDWGLARLQSGPCPSAETQSEEDDASVLRVRSGSDSPQTRQGSIVGTLGYAPPEQVSGNVAQIDERSDVYALGAILYQMLTCKTPIRTSQRNSDEIQSDTVAGRIESPRQLIRTIPRPLEAICRKALQRKQADRYGSAHEFIDDLQRWKADSPVSAYQEPWWERLFRLGRRHQTVVRAAAAALVVIAITAVAASLLIQRQRDVAVAERHKTDFVREFMVEILQSPHPELDGRQVTVASLLDRALSRLARDEKEDPLNKAALLYAVGQSFMGLSLYNDAIRALELCYELRAQQLTKNHPDTLLAMGDLGEAYSKSDRHIEAVSLRQDILTRQEKRQGDRHPDTLLARMNLATSYTHQDLKTAATEMEACLASFREVLGIAHVDTLSAALNLAATYELQGKTDESLELLERTMKTCEEHFAPDELIRIQVTNNLAGMYLTGRRDVDRAISLFEANLLLIQARLGPNHADTLSVMNNLAECYRTKGQPSRAIEIFRQVVTANESILGPEHSHVLKSKTNLALSLVMLGNWDEALPLFEEVHRVRTEILPEGDLNRLKSTQNLAALYASVGQWEQARQLHEHVLKMRRPVLPAGHNDMRESLQWVHLVRLKLGQFEQAESVIQEWLTALASLPAANPVELLWARTSLAESQLGLEKYDGAAATARQVLEMSVEHPRANLERLRAKNILGTVLTNQDADDEAEQMLVESCRELKSIIAQMPAHLRWYVPRAYERIIAIHEARGDQDLAQEWQRELEEVRDEVDRVSPRVDN